MNIQGEVSLCPLRTKELAGPIEAFCDALRRSGLEVHLGSMSTRVSGNLDRVVAGLGAAFALVAERHDLVLVVKLSNCCDDDEPERRADA